MNNIKGVCACGCGEQPPIATRNHKIRGWVKGEPIKFVHGHNGKAERNGMWNGGIAKRGFGYRGIRNPSHHRADHQGYVLEHIMVAEAMIGRKLKPGEVVHHKNSDTLDNRPENLHVFENHSQHMLHHVAQRARLECGNPDWRKCFYCKQYDDPANLILRTGNSGSYHRDCRNKHRRERYSRGLSV